jgi:hypothetical protein
MSIIKIASTSLDIPTGVTILLQMVGMHLLHNNNIIIDIYAHIDFVQENE